MHCAFLLRGEREVEYRLSCDRWGSYVLGDLRLVAHDRFRVFRYERRQDFALPLKVYPRPELVRELLLPLETQVFTGNLVAREKGEGIEFADLRPFVPGDRVRRINWRASARRGELWVNELHAERNADVILFLDSFTEARRENESTLDRAVRGTSALAEHYLQHKDRVGLVSFGGVLNWLLPSTGLTQLYRIVDSLLDTEIVLNYAWKDIDVIPPRTLPPKALVIALVAAAGRAGSRGAHRPARTRLRPRARRDLTRAVRLARLSSRSSSSRSTSGSCGARRFVGSTSARAFPSRSGTTRCR